MTERLASPPVFLEVDERITINLELNDNKLLVNDMAIKVMDTKGY